MKLTTVIFGILIIFSAFGSLDSTASGLNSSYSFQKLQVSLCENAKLNQVVKLRHNLRQARAHIRSIYSEVSCQGSTLLSVAMDNNADKMVSYLKLKTNLSQSKLQSRLAIN